MERCRLRMLKNVCDATLTRTFVAGVPEGCCSRLLLLSLLLGVPLRTHLSSEETMRLNADTLDFHTSY